jgi:hypothetical protein
MLFIKEKAIFGWVDVEFICSKTMIKLPVAHGGEEFPTTKAVRGQMYTDYFFQQKKFECFTFFVGTAAEYKKTTGGNKTPTPHWAPGSMNMVGPRPLNG